MSKYGDFGVDVRKSGVELFGELISPAAIRGFSPIGIYKLNEREEGIVMHTDGAGSKPIISYIYWKETGDIYWFSGLSQDVVAMNINDLACVGASPICLTDYLAINPNRLPRAEVIKAIARGFADTLGVLSRLGMEILFLGGETADLPDQLLTLDISATAFGTVEIGKIVDGSGIQEGDVIVGLRSGGRAKFERGENSGIMCNGLTLARRVLLSREYSSRYPEVAGFPGRPYEGRFKVDDYLDEVGMSVGEALLSPTRLYAPIATEIIEKLGEEAHGLIHNTGGGLTKALRLGAGINYVKDDLPEPDPIFRVIQREGRVSWEEMYSVFNMGIGFEVVCRPEVAYDVIDIAEKHGVETKVIGRCRKCRNGVNKVTIISANGKFVFSR